MFLAKNECVRLTFSAIANSIPHPERQALMPASCRIPSITESGLRLVFGFLLWSVSATLTLVLLISLGDGSFFSKVLLGVVAIALEGAKILSWRKGGAYRVYAACLIILSGIASLGASLQVVEKSKGAFLVASREALHSAPAYLAQEGEIRSIDAEITALLSRLQTLPLDYTTAASRVESSLSSLRDRKQGLLNALAAGNLVGASQDEGTIVVLLSRAVGLRPDVLLLVLLLFVSAGIEVGALLLTVSDHESSDEAEGIEKPSALPSPIGNTSGRTAISPRPTYAPPITPEAFLEAAKDGADLPYLHGRDRTAEKLGISSAEAKRLVGRLLAERRIVVEGKRLRLAHEGGPSQPLPTTSGKIALTPGVQVQ